MNGYNRSLNWSNVKAIVKFSSSGVTKKIVALNSFYLYLSHNAI